MPVSPKAFGQLGEVWLEFWVFGFGLWALGFGFWVLGFGFWVLGFGFWGVERLGLKGVEGFW